MKVLWTFISATLAAAIGTLIAIAFQEPIAREFSGNRLVAQVYAAPWSPLFPTSGAVEKFWEKHGLSGYEINRLLSGDGMHFARIDIHNPGTKRVENIRLSLGNYPPNHIVILESELKPRLAPEAKSVEIQPLDPGASASVLFWTFQNVSSGYYFSDWKTFSSEGAISMTVVYPEKKISSDPVYEFLDTWVPAAKIAVSRSARQCWAGRGSTISLSPLRSHPDPCVSANPVHASLGAAIFGSVEIDLAAEATCMDQDGGDFAPADGGRVCNGDCAATFMG